MTDDAAELARLRAEVATLREEAERQAGVIVVQRWLLDRAGVYGPPPAPPPPGANGAPPAHH